MPISVFGAQRAGSVIRLLVAIAVVFGLVASCQKLDVTAVDVMDVEVSPTTATVLIGQIRQFTVTLTDAAGNTLQRNVNWSSANTGIATADSDGQVRGVTSGTTTVTASAGGRSGQATVNVAATLVTSVEVIPNTAGLRPGEFVDLQAVAKDGNGAVVSGKIPTWASQNSAVANVAQTGRVMAGVAGTTRVTATIDGRVGEAAITVTSDPVVSVQLLPPTGSVAEGEFLQLQTVLRNG
ncbi:MAG: Ig-like domain-containing protein, partial [Longimicrobiales bacterium]